MDKDLIKIFIAALLPVFFSLYGCTSKKDFESGKRQLEQQGYTDVVYTGYSAFCCDEKDTFKSGFSCKDKAGNTVKGCICSGVMKGVTIRFE